MVVCRLVRTAYFQEAVYEERKIRGIIRAGVFLLESFCFTSAFAQGELNHHRYKLSIHSGSVVANAVITIRMTLPVKAVRLNPMGPVSTGNRALGWASSI